MGSVHQQEAGVRGGGYGWGRGGVGTDSKTPDRGVGWGWWILRGDLMFRHSRGELDLKGGVEYSILPDKVSGNWNT